MSLHRFCQFNCGSIGCHVDTTYREYLKIQAIKKIKKQPFYFVGKNNGRQH